MDDLLGVQVRYNEDGSITLHQEKYIDKLVSRFLADGIPSSMQLNSLPYGKNIRELVDDALAGSTSADPAHPELVKPFQELIGSVMYACTACRCDIAYPVHLLCRAMSRPTPDLMAEALRVIAYLGRHRSVGITYSPGAAPLHGMTDASWETNKSTSGWFVLWQQAVISWGSRKQPCVALSSCEAEIIALSEGAKDMVYFRKLIAGLLGESTGEPSNLATDNLGARDLAYNPEHHERTKHVERRFFYVRDMVEAGELVVPYIGTNDNLADFLTKPLNAPRFFALRAKIMNEP